MPSVSSVSSSHRWRYAPVHGFDLYYYNNKRQGELDFVVEYQGKVVYMPIYMLMFLEKEQVLDVTYRLDLSDLNLD